MPARPDQRKIAFAMRIDKEDKVAWEAEAKRRGISVSMLIRYAMEFYVMHGPKPENYAP